MQKNLKAWALPLAMTLGASSASAQSSVTLYGRINTTLEWQKSGTENRTALENNASRFGFAGSEDLGGGLRTFFTLESDFDSTTGRAAQGFNRDAFVGIADSWGQVRLGNITNITYLNSADWVSMHNHDTGTSADALYGFGVAYDIKQNTVAYATPSWKGMKLEFSSAMREGEIPHGARNLTLSYDENGGPLELGAGYSASGPNRLLVFRALYTFSDFTVGGYYERDDFDGAKRNNLRLSGMYRLGQSEFHLNMGVAGDRGGVRDTGAKQFTMGYNYLLSKRTKIYSYYTRLLNEANASYAAWDSVNSGESQRSLAVGIRHSF